MKNFKKLVVGVDLNVQGSRLTVGSERAIEQAAWLAARNGGEVRLLHSTRADRYIETHAGNWAIVHEGVSPEGEQAFEKVVAKLKKSKIKCSISVREQRPYVAICLEARDFGADAVLLGKHEEGSESTKIGTVASNVLRNCPAPVWVVKPAASLAPEVVLAATDLTEVGGRAVSYGAFVANESEAKLHVVHAFQIEMAAQMAKSFNEKEELDAIRDKATQGVRDQVASAEFAGEPTLHVVCSSPSHAIIGLDKKLHPDLVVMGMISREGIPGLVLGNTAERVLGRLQASLLAIKPRGFVSPNLPQ